MLASRQGVFVEATAFDVAAESLAAGAPSQRTSREPVHSIPPASKLSPNNVLHNLAIEGESRDDFLSRAFSSSSNFGRHISSGNKPP
jgi:hypothetical protein